MSQFDDREQVFEKQFAMDEELQFKVMARRDKLLGLWAADKLGLTGQDAQDYAMSVVKADLREPGDEDVFEYLQQSFADKNMEVSEHQIRREMDSKLDEAREQVMSEAGK